MTIIRRVYAYLLAFAGLTMVALAAANLAQALLDTLVQSPLANADRYLRDTVSLWGATALVGLPVWLLHWLWIQRTVRSDPDERTSALRRLYLFGVLAAAMLGLALSLHQTMQKLFDAVAGVATAGAVLDGILRPLPFTLVAGAVWLAHWRIAAGDRAAVGEIGRSGTLRRWYLYGAALIGLLLLLSGGRSLIEVLWQTAAPVGPGSTSAPTGGAPGATIAAASSDALVGLGLWLVHWVILPTRLLEATRREDGVSVLRSVYLFLALSVGVIGTLLGASQLLYYAVGRLLGVARPGGIGGDLLQAAAGPASAVIVYGAAWTYQRHTLRHQELAFNEAPRQAGIRRLYTYVIALVALSVLSSGVAGLLWTLGDVLFAPGASAGDVWRERVALYATLAIVGLPVWLVHWLPKAGSVDEAHSLARRLYVYLSLIAGMLTAIASLAGALYRLLGLALGGSFGQDVATDLAHALGVATVAAIVTTYHWRVLRADARQAVPHTAAGPRRPADLGPPDHAMALVEIHAAHAVGLEQALAALRASGVDVRVLQSSGGEVDPASTD